MFNSVHFHFSLTKPLIHEVSLDSNVIIPKDIWMIIFSKCNEKEICQFRRTNKYFYRITKEWIDSPVYPSLSKVLLFAAALNQLEKVQTILKQTYSLARLTTEDKKVALYVASRCGHVEVVKQILSELIDQFGQKESLIKQVGMGILQIQSEREQVIIQIATIASQYGRLQVVREAIQFINKFIDHHFDLYVGNIIKIASSNGQLSIVQEGMRQIRYKYSEQISNIKVEKYTREAILVASEAGQLELLKHLLEEYLTSLEDKESFNDLTHFLLENIIKKGEKYPQIIEYILSKKFINSSCLNVALDKASEHGFTNIVKIILDKAKQNSNIKISFDSIINSICTSQIMTPRINSLIEMIQTFSLPSQSLELLIDQLAVFTPFNQIIPKIMSYQGPDSYIVFDQLDVSHVVVKTLEHRINILKIVLKKFIDSQQACSKVLAKIVKIEVEKQCEYYSGWTWNKAKKNYIYQVTLSESLKKHFILHHRQMIKELIKKADKQSVDLTLNVINKKWPREELIELEANYLSLDVDSEISQQDKKRKIANWQD